MEAQTYYDVLAGRNLELQGSSVIADTEHKDIILQEGGLFFPGCAFINFGRALTNQVFQDLKERGLAQGISLMCCGKILQYEDATGEARNTHHTRLLERLKATGVTRIITACPNCLTELQSLFEKKQVGDEFKVLPLPAVLAEADFHISEKSVEHILALDEAGAETADARIAVHDSCPDRHTGIFAEGVRALFPQETLTELEHNRKKSRCCGSLARAAGNAAVMERQALERGIEGEQASAQALVTACMSCANILGRHQKSLPVHHYLEFLYEHHIAWQHSPVYMELRILFEELHGQRSYQGTIPPEESYPIRDE